MRKLTFIPLVDGTKRPAVKGWARADYKGIDPLAHESDYFALRTDGLVVVDADTMEAAEAWMADAPATPFRVRTKRGMHFYYRLPDGAKLKSGPLIAGQLDIKTGPGSFVLPIDSRHPSGHAYEWAGDGTPLLDVDALPEAPVELIHRLRPPKPEVELGEDEGWSVIPEGARNVTLTALAGMLRKQGASGEVIASVLAFVNKHRTQEPLDDAELLTITRSVLRYEPEPDEADGDIIIVGDDDEVIQPGRWRKLSMNDMELPPPPNWLWAPYIPEGRLVLLDGAEGIGKGLLCAYAAVNVSSGAWGEGGPVLWFAAEDDPVEDVQRRLLAAGYERGDYADVDFVDAMPRFPGDLHLLAQELLENRYKLVILDPGRSYLGPDVNWSGSWSYNDEAAVRPGLQALNHIAKAAGTTIIFVHHWNKNSAADVEDRAAGSKAFRQVVRHVLSMAFVGDTDTGEGALAVTKSNIGPTGHLIGYHNEAAPEYATARWVQDGPLAEHRMKDWITRATQAQSADVGIEFDVDTLVDVLSPELEPGGVFPSPRELNARFGAHGLSRNRAMELKQELIERGLVRLGAHNRLVWMGERKELTA